MTMTIFAKTDSFFRSLLLCISVFLFVPVHAQHIAAGRIHSLYLDPDGNVWVWGRGGPSGVPNERIPHIVMPNGKAVFAAPQEDHAFVLKQDGTLWGWGDSNYGELGVINRKGYVRARYIDEPKYVTKDFGFITGSKTIFALKQDGSLWVWGSFGIERGDKINKEFIKPVKVMNNVAQVSSAFTHTLVLKKDGTLLAWGDNQCGALGIGNTKDHVKPVRVNVRALGKRKIAKIFARSGDSFIIADDGTVWNWGEPGLTYPGCHDEPRLTPVRLDIDNVKDIALSFRRAIFLKKDGTVWVVSPFRMKPDVPAYSAKLMDDVSEIAAGEYHYIALKKDGTVWAWGNNQFGQIGNGTDRNADDPVQVHFPEQ